MHIEQEIKSYIQEELLFDREDLVLGSEDPLLEAKIIDSMALVQLIEFLEQQYGLAIEESELNLDNFKTISRIASFVRRMQAQADPGGPER